MLKNKSQPKSERSELIVWVFSEHLWNNFVSGEHMKNNSMKINHGNEFKNRGTQRVAKSAKVRISLLFFQDKIIPDNGQYGWVRTQLDLSTQTVLPAQIPLGWDYIQVWLSAGLKNFPPLSRNF